MSLDELSEERSDSPEVPQPPEQPAELLAWADEHVVSARLDDVIFADEGRAGTYLPTRDGEVLTYRQVLVDGERRRRSRWSGYYDDTWETARRYLHDIATIVAARRAARVYLDTHGREPEDQALAALLARLRAALIAPAATPPSSGAPLPLGTYQPTRCACCDGPRRCWSTASGCCASFAGRARCRPRRG